MEPNSESILNEISPVGLSRNRCKLQRLGRLNGAWPQVDIARIEKPKESLISRRESHGKLGAVKQ